MKKIVFALLALILILQGCAAQVQTQPGVSAAAFVFEEPTELATAQPENSPSKSPSPTSEASASAKEINATGVYQGQADNNFIEIKITGQPEDKAYMMFMLTGEIKGNFETTGLKTGDTVQIRYYENASGQHILTELINLQK